MERVHVVTYVSFDYRQNEVVGVFATKEEAIKAAEEKYLKVCNELYGIEPQQCSPCTLTVTIDGVVQAFVEVNNLSFEDHEYFPVTYVSREDLESIGYDAKRVDDCAMERLANKMGNAYCDSGYWDDLQIIADYFEIPKKSDEPTFIEADTAGFMLTFPDDEYVFYIGDTCPPMGNGMVYKDKASFDEKQGICYVPEAGFENLTETRDLECDSVSQERVVNYLEHASIGAGYVALDGGGYTYDDLRDCVYLWIGKELSDVDDYIFELFVDYMTEQLFNELDWMCPQTWLNELDVMEQWENAPQLSCEDPRFDEHGNRK